LQRHARLCAETDYQCIGSTANGKLPSNTAIGSTFQGTDVTLVAGPPNWDNLAASKGLSCNKSMAYGASAPGQSSEDRIDNAFSTACPEVRAAQGDYGFVESSDDCTATCLDYITNLGVCQASNKEVEKVRNTLSDPARSCL
jgi:hypothetical protein